MNDRKRLAWDSGLRDRYARDGFVLPLDLMPADEAAQFRRRIEAIEAEYSRTHPLERYLKFDPHILIPTVSELAHDPRILDCAEFFLGPDLMLANTNFFLKEPRSPDYITWHQDLYYVGLEGDDYLTVWLALSPSNQMNGCMRFLRGSHRERFPHRDTFAKDNMLTRGQTVDAAIDESRVEDVVLAPGQASVHHGWMAHASAPNRSDDRRIGLVIRYMSPRLRQTASPDRDYAILVRGQDRYQNFVQIPLPERNFDPEAIALYEKIREYRRTILYKGAQQTRY